MTPLFSHLLAMQQGLGLLVCLPTLNVNVVYINAPFFANIGAKKDPGALRLMTKTLIYQQNSGGQEQLAFCICTSFFLWLLWSEE